MAYCHELSEFGWRTVLIENNKMDSESPELTLDEISELGETDPVAADLALVRIRTKRDALNMAKGMRFLGISSLAEHELAAKIEKHDPASDGDIFEEIIALSITSSSIQHVGEAPTGLDKQKAEPVKENSEARTKSKILLREAYAKYSQPRNRSSSATRSNDNLRVIRFLKKAGRTLGDLPSDWDTLPETAEVVGERSRRNELYRVAEEGRAELHATERRRQLEEKGLPANYDALGRNDRERLDAKIRQRQFRSRKAISASKPTARPTVIPIISGEKMSSMLKPLLRRLQSWAEFSNDVVARQMKRLDHQKNLVKAAIIYSRFYNQNQRAPSHREFGDWLKCSKDQARRRLDKLKVLYSVTGPWHRLLEK